MNRLIFSFGLLILASSVFAQNNKLPVVKQPVFKKDSFYITRYGAKPDGITLNTKSINNAINDCSRKGGGVVVIPSGFWLTGPIELKSNVNLHLQKNALLQFTKDFSQYKLVAGNWEGLGQMRNQSPVSATNATNIAITGFGIIDGNGDAWRMVKKDKLTETQWQKLVASGGVLSADKKVWYPSEKSLKGSTMKNPGEITPDKAPEFYESVKDFLRPNLLVFTRCKKVLLEGVTFQNSPAWCLHPLMCEDLTVRNVYAKNPWYAQNGDGIDVESCKNVLIEGSTFDVGDDGICIKSGRDEAGRKRGMPTENLIARNNVVYHAHGGFVIGSEMSGGARNLYVDNCTFIGTDVGLRFKTTRGRGGVVENVFVNHISMKDIAGEAILFDMYYAAQDPVPLAGEKREPPKVETLPVTEATPQFRNFYIKNIVCDGAQKAIFIRGLPEMNVKNVVMENMIIQSNKGLDMTEAANITLKNVDLLTKDVNPVMNIHNSKNILLNGIDYASADLLLNVSGEKSKGIVLTSTNVSNAKKDIEFSFGAKPSAVSAVSSEEKPDSYAAAMAHTVMTVWKDSLSSNGRPARWTYDQSVILKGIEGLWRATGEKKYFDYIQKSMDLFVDDEGNIRTYKYDDLTLDNIAPGRNLLLLYNVTGKEKYLKAIQTLRKQLSEQPRTKEGGFWHKKVYPYQMWLDGLYMAEPFYGEYANTFHEDTIFNDIARQFILMEKNALDKKTGLLYHGYDESRQQKWADKTTGRSPNFWARAMGWYGMGLVDALETFPVQHPKRNELIQILNRFAKAISKVQDTNTGLWWDILNMPNKEKNYSEASASCMFVYALAKGVRLGYLPSSYLAVAKKGYDGILNKFIFNEDGQTNLHGTVSVSGLGGNPYRDGSYDYYMSEKVVVNDPKGVGSFILAANEMEMLPTLSYGRGKTVVLDNFFNNEWRKDATGTNIRYHYTWKDEQNSGFSTLADIFHSYGVQTKSLGTAPSPSSLKKADIYIIVDPDTDKETAKPNYLNETYANTIADWVKAGGVLILMTNDNGNADLVHTNILASKFGVKFNEDNYNLVQGNQYEQGAIMIPADNSVFKTAKKVYIKELSTLIVNPPATTVLAKEEKNIVAVAQYGKGSVFIVGDPWFYNEYTDGRKLPSDFDNFKAAQDLVKWAIDQSNKK